MNLFALMSSRIGCFIEDYLMMNIICRNFLVHEVFESLIGNVCFLLRLYQQFVIVLLVCVSAAGLFCDPSVDGTFLVLPEDSLQADPLCGCDGVFVGGGGNGRS